VATVHPERSQEDVLTILSKQQSGQTFKYTFSSNNPDSDLLIPMCGLYGYARAEEELAKRKEERKLIPAFKWLESLTQQEKEKENLDL
jgi:hypothetical protein